MLGVNVYEIDPAHFRLKRHIFAERAHWEPTPATRGFSKRLEPRHERRTT